MVASAGVDPRWNHNIHYHRLVIEAVPPGCRDALDLGCGDGMLARKLRAHAARVVALDRDEPTLRAGRTDDVQTDVEYVLGDLLAAPFPPASFDFVASVAVLHHVDARAGLTSMARLLRPGGRLAVIGLARSSQLADVPFEIAGVFATRFYSLVRDPWEHSSPRVWPPPETYAGMRRIAANLLPGSCFRQRVMWRYSLIWTKPD